MGLVASYMHANGAIFFLLQPCHSPKAQTRTHKNFSSCLTLSGPSPVNNTHHFDVYGGAISSVVTQRRRQAGRNVTHFPILSQTISSNPRRCYLIPFRTLSPAVECLLPLLMSPLLAVICVIWIGVWKGPPYRSVISVGGSMDVSSGRRIPIKHVSSSNGWTRTHAHVAVQ
ncbi:hypothetical protein SO802_021492 [Lithocarpus litseifolius]|uniref:Uncharacterized protein n=1 Tax=Lithocarpus litseifolius TaxID=425828 RepID=A0AAW2CGC0_9ROSI